MHIAVKILSDTLSYFTSVYFSILFYNVPFTTSIYEINFYLIMGGYLFFIISIINYKGYEYYVEFSTIREATALINAAISMIIVSILTLFVFQINIPSFLTSLSQLIFCLSLVILPILIRIIFHKIFPLKLRQEPTLLIGVGEMGKSFILTNKMLQPSRFNILGIIDDSVKKGFKFEGIKVLGGINDIKKVVDENNINKILVAVRDLSEEKISFLDSFSINNKIGLNFIPSIESFKNNPGKLSERAGIPLLSNRFKKQSLFYKVGKRFFDIIISLIGILISIPFWLIIPILIKKDTSGPIIFKQERVGLNNEIFSLLKFRTMHKDSPKYAHCPTDTSDPRITKIGRWLRKTSLDELPQLLNVLSGEMSLVGPRPEMKFIVDNYNTIEKKRLLIKPGVTGLWQISPYRQSEISHNLEYDFYYIEHQGFVLDLVILILTFFFALRGFTI